MSDKFELRIQLTVLNDLGIKLYSNTPAVLSELVANSWDADANQISVDIHVANKTIIIQDDGCGMSRSDLQDKYLTVGYQKRGDDNDKDETPGGRKIMGRKGIGKLSMFSIAKEAIVETVQCDEAGNEIYRGGLKLELDGIAEAARNKSPYHPSPIVSKDVRNLKRGTRITLTEIDKRLASTIRRLRTRLARRFSVASSGQNFEVMVNGTAISPEERGYFHRLQYVWWIGDSAKDLYASNCNNLAEANGHHSLPEVDVIFDGGKVGKVSGWIGFVHESRQTRDDDGESLNKVILMVRGKLAMEDLLPAFKEDRLGKVYMMGEVHADFMDDTRYEDIALSSRQGVKEDTDRYKNLIESLSPKIKSIVSEWDKLRKQKDEKDILDLPGVKQWMSMLDNEGDKKFAKSLVSKITSSTNVDKDSRKTAVKYCVLAFESLRYQDRLHSLDSISGEEIANLAEVFSDISRLEASAYGEIARGRISAIEKLQSLIDGKALEKEFQRLIADNLWLLDAAWERAVKGDLYIERSILDAWTKIQNAEDLEKGRVDIAYKTVAGLDIIVELKRSSIKSLKTIELLDQCNKYLRAYRAAKKQQQQTHYQHKIFLVVGHLPKEWESPEDKEEAIKQLESIRATVLTYEQLLSTARESYRDYLESQVKISDLQKLLAEIESA